MSKYNFSVSFEDLSENEFFGWEILDWITLVDGKEMIYGYSNMDDGKAELVHIQNGECLWDYQIYHFELGTNEGSYPALADLSDVADFVDTLPV